MPLDSRRLLEESVPVGGLLLVWYTLSALALPIADGAMLNALVTGFQTVGTAVAVVFVVVRGVAIARETRPVRLSSDVRELLDESTVVAVPVLAWAGLAALIALPYSLFQISADLSIIAAAFVQTAVATAALYVVIRVVPVLRSGLGSGGTATLGDD
ncbi:hypothetical protein [Halococcus agarilyticus]|uniref:hypothetical protein n=1 Tax=Halococcus agarilyticus TaxID=1232219 RepID=UPI0006780929|nr:hypothetical protein [Halococcus agarilyticus]